MTKAQIDQRLADVARDAYDGIRDVVLEEKRDREYKGKVKRVYLGVVHGKRPGVVLTQDDEEIFVPKSRIKALIKELQGNLELLK